MNNRNQKKLASRRGTTIVETAIVLPVFLFFLFAIIEFGHAQLVNNMLNSACRNGARIGSVEGTTTANVIARVNQTMAAVTSPENVSIFVNDAGVFDLPGANPETGTAIEGLPAVEIANLDPRQMFVVRATLNYNDIALLPMDFMEGVVLNGQAFIRHE